MTLGDWRIFLLFMSGYVVAIVLLVVGQITTGAQAKQHKAQGVEETYEKESDAQRSAGAIVGEVVGAIRTVAAFNAESRFLDSYRGLVAEQRQRGLGWRLYAGSAAMGVAMSAMMLIFGSVLWYSFWLIENAPGTFLGSSTAPGCGYTKFEVGRVMVSMMSMVGIHSATPSPAHPFTPPLPLLALPFTAHLPPLPSHSQVGMLLAMGNNAAMAVDAAAAALSAKALFKWIDRPSLLDPSSGSGETLDGLSGDLELKGVVFAYPSRPDFRICRGYSLAVSAGQVCALCGPSGSGKSTIIALLERFYDPQAGSVTLDGADIRTLNLRWLRSRIGLVGQEPVLFQVISLSSDDLPMTYPDLSFSPLSQWDLNGISTGGPPGLRPRFSFDVLLPLVISRDPFQGSVAENIGHGKAGATQEEIEEAAKLANAHVFITQDLGQQYLTDVGLRGGQLSGGQKQRVAIARALVRQPALLLFDEATSALDNESEKVVQAALDSLMTHHKRTTIMIAHRLSTIRDADMIAVVSKGVVVETGTHDVLRDKRGLYAELLSANTVITAPKVARPVPGS